jgi:hypothetical protein
LTVLVGSTSRMRQMSEASIMAGSVTDSLPASLLIKPDEKDRRQTVFVVPNRSVLHVKAIFKQFAGVSRSSPGPFCLNSLLSRRGSLHRTPLHTQWPRAYGKWYQYGLSDANP